MLAGWYNRRRIYRADRLLVIQREPVRPVPPNSVAVLPFELLASFIERQVTGNSCNCHERPKLGRLRPWLSVWYLIVQLGVPGTQFGY
jgi:hypothetical protein